LTPSGAFDSILKIELDIPSKQPDWNFYVIFRLRFIFEINIATL